jgi:hypothetical protein
MQRINTHQLGIEQDSILLFSDFQDGGAMWTEKGPRELRRVIEFSERFSRVPSVTVGLSMLDMDQASNHRVDICAELVTEIGFVIVFRTWGDTRVARVRADWQALGALPHEDDWDV